MTTMLPQQRVFFALWPDAGLRASLSALARGMSANGRPVPTEHLHLTLAFPGTVPAGTVAEMQGRADELRLPEIRLVLEQLGWFRRPR
ncbi:MAG: RNA 2',3'-cyclic phosphodiesterase, partial [Thioalkalivibrio sp.]|nr:RNA 2',3'-cyclic phosphodiesterase [Thioalkalivibrio sp.]